MTPQLQQAIKMLQLSNVELAEFVEAEIEQNPLLEHGEADPDEMPIAAPEAAPPVNGTVVSLTAEPTGGALAGELAGDAADHWRAAAGEEGDGSLDRADGSQPWQSQGGGGDDADMRGIDQAAARPRTLREHLIEQIGADLADLADRVIALHLLDQLDEAGYLRGDLSSVAELLGCPVSR